MPVYRQFCPVAKASEIFAERWTPLILRELLMGSHRFGEIEAGVPRISKSLLTQRLRFLERAGLVVRRPSADGRVLEYHLTLAGQELYGVVEQLGVWGQRWTGREIDPDELDPDLLMWDMRRRIHLDRLPDRRVVVQFDFTGRRTGSYWLILERHEVSVCLDHPGYESDLFVVVDALAFHNIWMGHLSFDIALRNRLVQIDGPSELAHAFPGWLKLNTFAHIQPVQDSTIRLAGR
ncbi:MAG TPA: helix-turn-helix domain-containing protein [Nitrolancea sp.]|jgi:DNA-binding HxlR family transcriptional regulator|nr:helix-turn-helix domain-containing protein [Nitrolancea sp.]